MNGDLSLSKALGGLRIANPDDATDGTALRQAGRSDDPDAQSTNILYGSTPSTLSKQPHQDSGSSQQIEGDLESRELAAIMQNPNTLSPALLQSHSAGPSQEGNIRDSRRFHSTPQRLSGIPGVNNAVSMAKTAKNVENQYSTSPGGGAIPNLQSETQTSISSEDWKDRGAAVGIRREMDSNGRMIVRQVKKGVRDFSFGRVLGEGSYSTVFLATDRQTLKEYAIKVLEKRHIIKEKKIKYVNIEKNTLNRLTEHPGIVRLYYTFQDEMSLYYVLDLCNGGELLGVLKKTGTFDLDCTRFYGAQILDAIEYMHSRGVIHRDIKPENVLLNEQMHIKITDFGTAKLLRDPRESRDSVAVDREAASVAPSQEKDGESERAASFVGTAEYVSPELLTHKSSCKASDLWAFGCIIYQLLAGRPPFKAGSEYLTFQKIVNLEYEFPTGFPASARDLVERCLVLEPARRLTVEHIKNHEFFAGQQFGKSLWRAKAPRLRAFIPPAQEPVIIQLNGYSPSAGPSSTKADYSRSSPYPQPVKSTGSNRPVRIITELPPPTQLDIEWSPVLTRNNERILKLADLMVLSTPLPNSLHRKGSDEGHKKLSRFFGGSTTKKRQRLVMVTSSGRIVLAPAGGEEKRAKQELSLLASDSSWKTQSDAKGQPVWSVDTGGYHYTFEESKGSLISDGGRSSAEEWIETLDKARDMALSLSLATPGDDGTFGDMSSAVSSPSSTFGSRAQHSESYGPHDRTGRNHLSKSQGNHDDSGPRRNRFSKRQSRSGLGSAF